jgi:hypothetical protein
MGTSWGVLRYPWTTVKLLLVISVMLVGTLVLPPADELRSGAGDPETWLIAWQELRARPLQSGGCGAWRA